MLHSRQRWRGVLLAGLLLVGGCQTRKPDFLTRVHQDCAAGAEWACELLDALNGPVTAAGVDPAGKVVTSGKAE